MATADTYCSRTLGRGLTDEFVGDGCRSPYGTLGRLTRVGRLRRDAITVDRCGHCSKRDLNVVHSDEMICILIASAAKRTNDSGCRPSFGEYSTYGGVTK